MSKRRNIPGLVCLAAGLMLGGCAAVEPLPAAITSAPPGNVQLVEVMRNQAAATGTRVRWGGTVVQVDEEAGGVARVEVLERKLDAGGRPLDYTSSDGRFVIRAAPEVDPWRYRLGSEVTVAGTVSGWVPSSAGGSLPLLQVAEFVHWSPPRRYHRPLYYDDPLWGPGPWYRDPWFRYGYGYPYGLHYGVGVGF